MTTPKSAIVPILERIGLPHRTLLVQESGALPLMRPPILLDTLGLRPLVLARVLDNLAGGRLHGWKAGQPIPIAIVGVRAYAHQRLLACSPAIAAVIGEQVNPLTLPVCMTTSSTGRSTSATARSGLALARQGCPSRGRICVGCCLHLVAPPSATLAAAWHVSRDLLPAPRRGMRRAGAGAPCAWLPGRALAGTLLEALEQPF
ncbi:MAG: hypothetical protein U0Z44_05895 [Kouleothrix sp.]